MPYFFLQPCFWGFFLFVSGSLFAQMPDYAHPINGPLLVTGTFGELRGDHFHAGLDFRASVGTPVYSIGDGYISRIKISAGGYGQAIYIDHPEGYRSVYCHLSGLRSDLMDSVRARQYQREKFVIDLRFDSLTFPVKRGDKIGAVGNRGYSFGPHLHFEIRDSHTDAGLNPLDFGMNVPDTRRPTIRSLKVYELDKGGNTLQEHEIRVVRRGNGVYYLPDPVAVSSSHIGIGIKAYDQQNALNNFNGIFRGELRYDSISLFAFQFRNIPFELTRYLNAHTDYRAWTAKESWYHRLFRLPGDELGIYEVSSTQQIDGQLYVKDGMIRRIPGQDIPLRIFITDQAGNFSTVDFSLTDGADSPLPTGPAYQYFLPQNEAS
ncbi:MAG: M23 family metallopeptidase, partial [Bacteroidota bacterium]